MDCCEDGAGVACAFARSGSPDEKKIEVAGHTYLYQRYLLRTPHSQILFWISEVCLGDSGDSWSRPLTWLEAKSYKVTNTDTPRTVSPDMDPPPHDLTASLDKSFI